MKGSELLVGQGPMYFLIYIGFFFQNTWFLVVFVPLIDCKLPQGSSFDAITTSETHGIIL